VRDLEGVLEAVFVDDFVRLCDRLFVRLAGGLRVELAVLVLVPVGRLVFLGVTLENSGNVPILVDVTR
jgi:hypothetical protein